MLGDGLTTKLLRGRQEVLRRQGTEEATEGPRQQQRTGARLLSLAGDVDEDRLQALALLRAAGDEEVTGEGVAVGRTQRRLDRPLRRQPRHLALLAAPLVLAQLAQNGMSFVSTVMVGRLGPSPLAGMALGATVFSLSLITFLALVRSVSPLAAQAVGAVHDRERVGVVVEREERAAGRRADAARAAD